MTNNNNWSSRTIHAFASRLAPHQLDVSLSSIGTGLRCHSTSLTTSGDVESDTKIQYLDHILAGKKDKKSPHHGGVGKKDNKSPQDRPGGYIKGRESHCSAVG